MGAGARSPPAARAPSRDRPDAVIAWAADELAVWLVLGDRRGRSLWHVAWRTTAMYVGGAATTLATLGAGFFTLLMPPALAVRANHAARTSGRAPGVSAASARPAPGPAVTLTLLALPF